jgi:hypothetical protein
MNGRPDRQADEVDAWPPPGWFKDAPPHRDGSVRLRSAQPARLARFAPSRVAWPWWLLWPWALAWAALQARQAGLSWPFFAQGGQLLLGSGPGAGLRLYASHPELQIGPLALAVAAVLRHLGPGNGEDTAVLAMSLTGPLMLAAVWRLLPAAERRRPGAWRNRRLHPQPLPGHGDSTRPRMGRRPTRRMTPPPPGTDEELRLE